jgi:hypothetical protein
MQPQGPVLEPCNASKKSPVKQKNQIKDGFD